MRIVLLPGMDGTGKLFAGLVAELPVTWEVVIVHYPPEQVLSYKDLGGFVEEACHTSKPFVLLAESYSTSLALEYASTCPPNLQALILCAGFATSPVRGWRRLLAQTVASFIFYVPLPKAAARWWLLGDSASDVLVAQVRVAVAHTKPNVLAARLRTVLACDVRRLVPRVSVPVLYLQAIHDRLVGSRSVEEIIKLKPTMEIAVLDGPHLLLQREPSLAAQRISAFLDAVYW